MIRRIVDYEIGWRFSDDCPGIHIRPEGFQELITLPVSDNALEALFLLNLLQGEKDLYWDDVSNTIQTHAWSSSSDAPLYAAGVAQVYR